MRMVGLCAPTAECTGHAEESETSTRNKGSEVELLARLNRTIEGELIPRLLLLHRPNSGLARNRAANREMDQNGIQDFAALLIAMNGGLASAYVENARENGRPLEEIIMSLLAPAANYLGELWDADRCSFTEVTVGLSRLRQILREIGPEFEKEKPGWRHGRRALLMPVPGEQHTFGIYVVEAFFRREGWDVSGAAMDSVGQAALLAERQWFAIAGFSLSSERFFDKLPGLISSVRRKSCNPAIGILVGGPLFLKNPHLVAEAGADECAADGPDAVAKASELLGRMSING